MIFILTCINCEKEYNTKSKTSVCCSQQCIADYKYKRYIELWKAKKESGLTKKGFVCKYIKRYLCDKHLNSCSVCGWGKRSPYTNKTPLQIDHIDGDRRNNSEDNLRLLCPNCHSLTPTFGILNVKFKGKNRKLLKDPIYDKQLSNQKDFYTED